MIVTSRIRRLFGGIQQGCQAGGKIRYCHVYPVYHQHRNSKKICLEDELGKHSYQQIYNQAQSLAKQIQEKNNGEKGKTVAFMSGNNKEYLVAQWAVWLSGSVAVPLCASHPTDSIRYYLEDSQAGITLVTETLKQKLDPLQSDFKVVPYSTENENNQTSDENSETNLTSKDPAMILYTSGTTGPPKGVVLTHGNLYNQAHCLLQAWEYSGHDRLLHCLPLHHTHGIVNCLLCPLAVEGTVYMLPSFNAAKVWEALLNNHVNVFMAVPTIYAKLLEHSEKVNLNPDQVFEACKNIRLMVSGSAALPTPILHKWKELTGHTLLERYGMTEIGMALSNPLKGTRTPGAVGSPLPGVQARIIRPGSDEILAEATHQSLSILNSEEGELQIRGPNVFKEYLNKPEATLKEFDGDWFKTGDTSMVENGVFRILGRTSVDIIKSGGYKISALDIERVLLTHPQIQDISVVGIPDPVYGQKIAAVIVLAQKELADSFTLHDLRSWCKDRMPKYWLPTELRVLPEMPRNAMGKVNKKELIKSLFT
eukprot:TRINITY_DN3481_c0_g1_i3.p1 TRINITY_DN3481_c0_g1~~TRINITY_DN3481_c0_g1_i3.p1  ORF type:complete len:537 (-),score=68.13 TRINITY_DN3481_c0_g1_i3:162-1772(-)